MNSTPDNPSSSAPPATVAHVFAAPGVASGTPTTGVAGVGQVTFALCVVLGAIFVCAWFARRMRNIGSGRAGTINVVADVRLGPKERAVLLQVGGTQLLVGVAPGQINALHVLTEPVTPSAPATTTADGVSFKTLLRRSLGK